MSVSTSSNNGSINNCLSPCGIPGAPSLGPINPPESSPSIHQCHKGCPFYGRPGHDGYSSSSSSCPRRGSISKKTTNTTCKGSVPCKKKVSCKGTQKYRVKWSAIYISGDPCGGHSTGCARCAPGSSGTVVYEKRASVFIDGPGSYTGEGCGTCPGCPQDYIAKKAALEASKKTTRVNVTYNWVATSRGCKVGCPNLCYVPRWTKPSWPDETPTLNWGCGPCDKIVPCTGSCSGGKVSPKTLKLIKKSINSI